MEGVAGSKFRLSSETDKNDLLAIYLSVWKILKAKTRKIELLRSNSIACMKDLKCPLKSDIILDSSHVD
jgi:hypothetical protein